MIRSVVASACALLGVAGVVAGVALWSVPAALIVAGVVLLHVARTVAAVGLPGGSNAS